MGKSWTEWEKNVKVYKRIKYEKMHAYFLEQFSSQVIIENEWLKQRETVFATCILFI